MFVYFSGECEVAGKEVQVTVQAQVDKEKEMSKKEVMATEALWSNIWKGIYFYVLKQGKAIKGRREVLSKMYLTPLFDPVMFGSFVQKRTKTCRGYNTRRKRC